MGEIDEEIRKLRMYMRVSWVAAIVSVLAPQQIFLEFVSNKNNSNSPPFFSFFPLHKKLWSEKKKIIISIPPLTPP